MIYVICPHPALAGSEIIQRYIDTPENFGKSVIEAHLQDSTSLQIQVREIFVVGAEVRWYKYVLLVTHGEPRNL